MAKSKVETVARAAYLEDWRQTSTKTSLTTSSANVSSRTSRRTKRYTCTRCRANKLRMASLSPRAIRLTSVSSDSAWAAIDPESLIENVCESFQLVAGIVPQNVIIKYRV